MQVFCPLGAAKKSSEVRPPPAGRWVAGGGPAGRSRAQGGLGLRPGSFTLSLLSLADLGPVDHTASSHPSNSPPHPHLRDPDTPSASPGGN